MARREPDLEDLEAARNERSLSQKFGTNVPSASQRDLNAASNGRDVKEDQAENIDEEDDDDDEDGDDDDEYLIQKFTEAFNQVDVDKEGEIYPDQLGSVMAALGQVVGEEELEEMIADMTDDTDGAGATIKLDDYLDVMVARHKGQEISDEELQEAFSVFDVDDVGFIVAKDVRAVLLLLLDLQTKPEDIDAMFKATTKDPMGRVTFEEFRDIIRWKPPKTDRALNKSDEPL